MTLPSALPASALRGHAALLLDTAIPVETPEGIHLTLRPAGPIVRLLAWLLDTLVRIGIYIGLGIILPIFGLFGEGLFLLAVFLVEWFYPVVFEVLNHGATPGKMRMKIHVVEDGGVPVGWSASMIRNLLRVVDFLPLLYGFGVVCVLLHRDFKRLGDLAAGTLVVHDDVPTSSEAIEAEKGAAEPPPGPLSIDVQRAVMEFARRGPGFSQARAEELAELMGPLTGKRRSQAVVHLYRVANWLQGRR